MEKDYRFNQADAAEGARNKMTYKAWRITFQSSEQAARAAYSDLLEANAEIGMRRLAKRIINWGIVHCAFGALIRFVDMVEITGQERRDCITTLDVLRTKM